MSCPRPGSDGMPWQSFPSVPPEAQAPRGHFKRLFLSLYPLSSYSVVACTGSDVDFAKEPNQINSWVIMCYEDVSEDRYL